MSTVTSTAAATAQTQSRSEQASADLSSLAEDSLTLFLTQLEYQDPLEPMNSSDMMQSLATISDAGQTVQMNSNLEEIIGLLGGGGQFGTPVSYLGKTVEYQSPYVNLDQGEAQFSYSLEERPQEVYVTVYDTQGNAVFNTQGSNNLGRNTIAWNGQDNNGNQLPDGAYEVLVSALYEGQEDPISVNSTSIGRVTQTSYLDDDVVLGVGNITIRQDNVLSVFAQDDAETTVVADEESS